MLNRDMLQKLYRYGVALTRDVQHAHDLLQDAVEKVLSRPPKNHLQLNAYIKTIMRNSYIDELRRQKRYPEVTLETTDEPADLNYRALEQTMIDADRLEYLWDSFELIDREILYLWAVEEYTIQEIAEQTDTPRGTILSRIHRLRKRVQESEDQAVR